MDFNADFKDRRFSTTILSAKLPNSNKKTSNKVIRTATTNRIIQFIHKEEYLIIFCELMTGTQKGKRVL